MKSRLEAKYQGKVQTDPAYWWREAERNWRDAVVLINHGGSKESVCNLCHACLERAAKARLAETKGVGDTDKRHNLASLLRSSGDYDSLDATLRQFVEDVSDMHSAASYPDSAAGGNIWEEEAVYKGIILNTLRCYRHMIERGKGHGGKGADENGGD